MWKSINKLDQNSYRIIKFFSNLTNINIRETEESIDSCPRKENFWKKV